MAEEEIDQNNWSWGIILLELVNEALGREFVLFILWS